MNSILHKNVSRGLADHGWLISRHTFSFADYYNPERMNFGLLRVINDDIVKPSMGFGTHPHKNMEIISIPLTGSLRHQDSMGNTDVILAGEVQVMSAGSGLTHSEFNNSTDEDLNFLQIWIYPEAKDIQPRYEQRLFLRDTSHNRFQTLLSPDHSKETLWINQQAWLSMADIDAEKQITYAKHRESNGVYFFVIDGNISIEGCSLARRDGLGLVSGASYNIGASSDAKVVAIEVPMSGQ